MWNHKPRINRGKLQVSYNYIDTYLSLNFKTLSELKFTYLKTILILSKNLYKIQGFIYLLLSIIYFKYWHIIYSSLKDTKVRDLCTCICRR